MYIKSIRYGFANNSSSSHSIVFLGNHKAHDNIDEDFGWDFFTACSKESKIKYCFSTLLSQNKVVSYIPKTPLTEKIGWLNPFEADDILKNKKLTWKDLEKEEYKDKIDFARGISEGMKWEIIKEKFSSLFGEKTINDWKNGEYSIPYIDHQSVIALPRNPDGSVHIEFAKNLFSVLINENFAILGGNDNSDHGHELSSMNTYSDNSIIIKTMKILNMIGTENSGPICIYDEKSEDFIIQDNSSGNKIRLSFNSENSTKKSSFPELVDLKITDHCDYGCTFCYQSSTKKGIHGTDENISKAIKMLSNSGAMEIAIGGGEPTSHPSLLNILREIRQHNMLACFTTKNFNLHEHTNFKEIVETSNSIAFSCNSIAEIEKVQIIKNAMQIFDYDKRPKVYIQMIPELMSDLNFDNALMYISNEFYNTPVTLLGYKDFGFGEKYKPKNRFSDAGWIKNSKKIF